MASNAQEGLIGGRPSLPSTDRTLKIAAIETIPIRVPLPRTFSGSYYRMTHRSTILARVVTEEGIVGEAYGGDEDHSLLEIDAIIREEIAPHLIGEDAMAVERCWQLSRPPPSTSCATAATPWSPPPSSTPPFGTRSARPSASPSGSSGAAFATGCR